MNASKIEKSSKKIPWLAGLLGVQMVLAVVLFNMQNRQPAAQNEPLLAFDRETLDQIEIVSSEGQIKLEKKGGTWQIGDGLPALASRVDELLNEFAALRSGWAVATSAEAAGRFEVTEDKFRRRIHLRQGNAEVGALLLGTSPNFRHSHVRKPDASEIYSVKLDEFSLPVDQDSWLDNQLMRPNGNITALQFGEHKVEKISGQWPAPTPAVVAAATSEQAAESAQASAEAAVPTAAAPVTTVATAPTTAASGFDSAAFAKTLAELTVQGIVKDQAELDAPTTTGAQSAGERELLQIRWKVTTSEGVYDYQLLSKNEQYYIRRGDTAHTFKLSKTQYDALAKIQELRQS